MTDLGVINDSSFVGATFSPALDADGRLLLHRQWLFVLQLGLEQVQKRVPEPQQLEVRGDLVRVVV